MKNTDIKYWVGQWKQRAEEIEDQIFQLQSELEAYKRLLNIYCKSDEDEE